MDKKEQGTEKKDAEMCLENRQNQILIQLPKSIFVRFFYRFQVNTHFTLATFLIEE